MSTQEKQEIPKYIKKRREKTPGVIARNRNKKLIIALLIVAMILTFGIVATLFFVWVNKYIEKKYSK